MFGLLTIVYSMTFLTNAVCILNEERFLNRVGIRLEYSNKKDSGMRRKIAEMIRGVKTVAMIPLIAANAVFILYELVLG